MEDKRQDTHTQDPLASMMASMEAQKEALKKATIAEERRRQAELQKIEEERRTQEFIKQNTLASERAKKAAEESAQAYRNLTTRVEDLLNQAESDQFELGNLVNALNEVRARLNIVAQVLSSLANLTIQISNDVSKNESALVERSRLTDHLLGVLNNAVQPAPVGGATLQISGDIVGGEKRSQSGVFQVQ